MRRLLQQEKPEDFTTVMARKQLNGRGQRGAKWLSEPGKNLTFTVLKKFESFPVVHQFALNICVSLAICDVLQAMNISDVAVKWPNDIIVDSQKVCGILIENIIQGDNIKQSIIGVGLNVNQTRFEHLQRAASLKNITGRSFDLKVLLHKVLECLKIRFSELKTGTVDQLMATYEQLLFRKDLPSNFENDKGQVFAGRIRGVSASGKLVLELDGNMFKEFELKEVALCY